ncbi:MAG: diol dehydratase reactivase ATPase-like domain-containing protein [Actinomycetales bacterium]
MSIDTPSAPAARHLATPVAGRRALVEVRAGLDVGNATTEIVLVDARGVVLAADRTPTRGTKGSPESLRAAASLLRRTARRAHARITEINTCQVRPVRTHTVAVTPRPVDTGPIAVLAAGAGTAGGRGFGAGRPWDIRAERPYGPVVAVCPPGMGFRECVDRIRQAVDTGAPVRAVVSANDDGVLIANRLTNLPVIDQVDTEAALATVLLAVEVAAPGHPPEICTDTFALGSELNAQAACTWTPQHLARIVLDLEGVSNCLVGVLAARPATDDSRLPRALWPYGWRRLDPVEVAASQVGQVRKLTIDGSTTEVADLNTLPVRPLVADLRRGGGAGDVLLATLDADKPLVDPEQILADLTGLPVQVRRGASSEALAAQAGAWTTPGAQGAYVVDLGAGTADVVPASGPPTVAAGSGELLTAGLAAVLDVSRAIAEYAKRGPSVRAESTTVVEGEDGARRFLDTPLDGSVVGRLAVEGPVGFVALPGGWTPPEWRAVRRRAKAEVFGTAMRRSGAVGVGQPVLLVGGPAADDEVVLAVSEVLGASQPVGRGRVAAGMVSPTASVPRGTPRDSLGHRFAVAYGLTLDA